MNLFSNHLWFYIFIISFVFASFGNAQEFRLRAHHLGKTKKQILNGKLISAAVYQQKYLVNILFYEMREQYVTFPKLVLVFQHNWDVQN